jgi:putative ABC transport system permease protein
LTGILVGLGPALGATSGDPAAIVKDGGPATSSRARLRSRRLLVAAEIAVTVVLLTSSGLLLKSYLRLRGVDPGFQAEGVLVLPIALDGKAYAKGAGPYYVRLQEKLEAIPGVTAAGGATYLPGTTVGPDFFRPVWADGERPAAGQEPLADVRIATPSYFATLGIPMKRGRGFDGRDDADGQRVIVVNESLARRIWPGGDAVGRKLIIDYSTSGIYDYEVVGVAGDVRAYGLRSLPRPELYIPHPQRTYLMMNMAVRVAGDPAAFVEPIRKAVLEIDPLQPVHSISILSDLLGRSVQRDRLVTTLMALFSGSALALAVLGLYGVVSYQVSRRTREIGIRIALGARSSDVRWTILSQEAPLLAAGLALGFAASAALTGLVQAQLYEVSASDPATFLAAGAALTLALLAAMHGPSRRASRIDPLEVLKRP